ncbi:hypothetical protein AcW1_002752 [Taiwanofungus camphoratus]|nr:hypothetical protein AcV5_009575 [Antrodia cinnamomea]KAI0943005.1 hypothetical protein AcV7_002269 [Antrodia cinnamomea]KAI0943634.1 hypothetical protein AcW1_002752 [Antrodia cinnamomea]
MSRTFNARSAYMRCSATLLSAIVSLSNFSVATAPKMLLEVNLAQSTYPSLTFDDIMDIPDDDVKFCPSSAATSSRWNAMSLDFILSGHLSAGNILLSSNTSSGGSLELSGATAEEAVTHAAELVVNVLNHVDAVNPSYAVQGWAPADGNPYAILDPTELSAILNDLEPDRKPDIPCVNVEPTAISRSYPPDSFGVPKSVCHMSTFEDRKMTYDVRHQPLEVKDKEGACVPQSEPALRGPFSELQVNKCRTPVMSLCEFSARSRDTLTGKRAGRTSDLPAPAQRPRPAPPRGGVSPAVARSITHIRMARERAQHLAQTPPPSKMPSVLGRWPRAAVQEAVRRGLGELESAGRACARARQGIVVEESR